MGVLTPVWICGLTKTQNKEFVLLMKHDGGPRIQR